MRLRSLKDTSNIASSLFYTTSTLQLSLVGECRFLEDHLGFKEFTNRALSGEYDGSRRHLQKLILEEDWIRTIEKAKNQIFPLK